MRNIRLYQTDESVRIQDKNKCIVNSTYINNRLHSVLYDPINQLNLYSEMGVKTSDELYDNFIFCVKYHLAIHTPFNVLDKLNNVNYINY